MTRAEVEALVEQWQSDMQLTHWEIKIDWDAPLDPLKDRGMITRDNPYDDARLQLAANWETWSPRELNRVLVHELAHLITRDLEEAVEAVEPLLGEVQKILWNARYGHELEAVVDKFATLLVNALQNDEEDEEGKDTLSSSPGY